MPAQLNLATSQKTAKEEQPAARSLRIKTSSLKRTVQDLVFAQKEVAQEEQRLETMRHDQSDRVKQQENVVNEAKIMVPDAANRIRSAMQDLRGYMEKESASIDDMRALIEDAKSALAEGERVLSTV